MRSFDFREAIEYQFDCFVRKVLIRAAMSYHNECTRRLKHEISISTMGETGLNQLPAMDTYKVESTVFRVLEMDIAVNDELIAKALQTLPQKKRNIVLMFYYMDMADSEIASVFHLVRSTIYRHRKNALLTVRKFLEGIGNEQK